MRVILSGEILEDETAFRFLDQLLYIFENGRHVWDIQQPDEVLGSRWYRENSPRNQRTIGDFLNAPPKHLRARVIRVVQTPNLSNELNPKAAVSFLSQPLQILVEDPKGCGFLVEYLIRR